ncbi:MAG: chlorophyll synthesis pathway protein BchC [Proteobacteria bacterium]|nr:chlorophyll synthesis pathway protein BchC [Pseudomonadota bacterium]
MTAMAVVMSEPGRVGLAALPLDARGSDDLVVDVEWTGISSGTERLIWSGRMPAFPGFGYPLVPGYETVGCVVGAADGARHRLGERVFVPGARCYGAVRALFGGAASRLVVPAARATTLPAPLGEEAILLALAATAHHALVGGTQGFPDLIVGHGVLGRLLARVALALGASPPTVWERNPARHAGALGYPVLAPDADAHGRYRVICDASGDVALLDTLIARLEPGGEVVLAGFYAEPVKFEFAPAFMREARLRIAAEWKPADLEATLGLIARGALSLAGLVSHRAPAADAADAYRTAFRDPDCLKIVLDWRAPA